MKRIFSLALACALTLSLLSSCGSKNVSNGSASSSQPASSTDISEPEQPDVSEPETDSEEPDDSTESEVSQPAEGNAVLTLNRSDFTLKSAGATFKLKYTCEPDMDAIQEYTSSNEKVATVAADGTVTAVAPGTAVITIEYGGLTASCTVRCTWEESKTPEASPSTTTPSTSTTPSTPAAPSTPATDSSKPAASVDLAAFYATISGTYEFPSAMQLADAEVQDVFYPGLSDVSTQQCLVYANMMSMNMGEFVLVQVSDSKDVSTVKNILQSRIDTMVDGGAWYPESTEQWQNNSTVVSNGNYVMMVVNENAAAITKAFNDLF